MPLRSQFGEVVQMTRNEARLSTNTSRGVDHLEHIRQIIRRNVVQLAEDFDWVHLNLKKDSAVGRVLLQAGLKSYAFPTALNVNKISQAYVRFGNVWQRVNYGITYEHYSAFSPDLNQRTDPVTNWQFYSDIEFEVWPLPATNGVANDTNEFAFEGQRKTDSLLQDSDKVDMDDILVSLLAAAEILAGNNQKLAAQQKSELAVARLLRVRGNLGSKTRYTIGLGRIASSDERLYPRHPDYIRAR